MVLLRRLDAFVKTRPDLRQKSAVGGIITLVASTTAAILFVGQLYVYIVGDSHHSLRLSRSVSFPLIPIPKEGSGGMVAHQLLAIQGKLALSFHVTFTNLDCDHLDVQQDGASYRAGELSRPSNRQYITLRKPSAVERKKIGMDPKSDMGCTVEGVMRPPLVAGTFQITISNQAWTQASALITMLQNFSPDKIPGEMNKYNVSHFIHKIEFGKTFAQSVAKPLENHAHIIENEYGGIAVEQIQVKLVPTISEGILFREHSYQQSVVEHTVQPETLIVNGMTSLPGLVIGYDFVPLTVHHSDGRENILVFLGSLVSIVAGVFVTVGLVTGCVLHSATAVAKKVD